MSGSWAGPRPLWWGNWAQVLLLVRRHVASIFLCGSRLAAPKPRLRLLPPWLCRAGTGDLGTIGVLSPGRASGKEPACHFRRHKRCRFSPRLGISPGGGHGNPLQYSCLENPWTEGPGRLWSTGLQRVDTAAAALHARAPLQRRLVRFLHVSVLLSL